MKEIIKYLLCLIAYYSGVVFLFRRLLKAKSALVLTYHRVIADGDVAECLSQSGMVVRDKIFRKQLRYLRKAYDVVPLNELISRVQLGDRFANLCAVTFDDGWRDVHDNAYPVIRQLAIPATIFLTTGYIDSTRLFWPERITRVLSSGVEITEEQVDELSQIVEDYAGIVRKVSAIAGIVERRRQIDTLITKLKSLSRDDRVAFVGIIDKIADRDDDLKSTRYMLDWNEVSGMHENGMSFGSHTVNHVLLTHVPADDARREIAESKQAVENKLGDPSTLFAYPNGNWNDAVRELVIEAGFSAAVTASNTKNDDGTDPFLFGRLNVHDGISVTPRGGFSRAVFACEISGLLNLFRGSATEY